MILVLELKQVNQSREMLKVYCVIGEYLWRLRKSSTYCAIRLAIIYGAKCWETKKQLIQ